MTAITAMTIGGTWCRFSVGAAARSVDYLTYISRIEAVKEREQGTLLYHLPPEVITHKDSYDLLRDSLLAYAWLRAESEALHKEKGITSLVARTHYRAILSFERDIPTQTALNMTYSWLEQVFPRGRAVGFVHRNTGHPHLHIWIEARGGDGKKLHLSAREYRQIDEIWNRHYAQEMGRDEREHLWKKWRTEREKQRRREQWNRETKGRDDGGKDKKRVRDFGETGLREYTVQDNAERVPRLEGTPRCEDTLAGRDQPMPERRESATATPLAPCRTADSGCEREDKQEQRLASSVREASAVNSTRGLEEGYTYDESF